MVGAQYGEIVFKGRFQVTVGEEPVQPDNRAIEGGFETESPGLVDIGEQTGGAPGGLKEDVVLVIGIENLL